MTLWMTNPFSETESDRHQIWSILVERDINAFLENDWESVESDFAADRFVGHAGPSNPDHWRIMYPTLESYRDDWYWQAVAFQSVELDAPDKAEFLFRSTVLRDIDIQGDRAMAHKKFDGLAKMKDGSDFVLNWQTMYWLQRIGGSWKITGFLGYLPNPMPQGRPVSTGTSFQVPPSATQHKTAGPYSPVLRVRASRMVAISGQGPIDPEGNIIGDTIEEQTKLTLDNCAQQLATAGASLADVFKVVVYLGDMADWSAFNAVYTQYMKPPYPVRTAIQAGLWGNIKVEIDMLAVLRQEGE